MQLIFATIYGSHYIFVQFMGPTILFQLVFNFIYNTFNKRNFIFN